MFILYIDCCKISILLLESIQNVLLFMLIYIITHSRYIIHHTDTLFIFEVRLLI